MKIQKNVDTLDALLRITMGLTGVAWGTAEMIKRRNRTMPLLMTMCSAMKVAEGITRYCPVLDLMGKNSKGLMENSRTLMENMKGGGQSSKHGMGEEHAQEQGKDQHNETEELMNQPIDEVLEKFK